MIISKKEEESKNEKEITKKDSLTAWSEERQTEEKNIQRQT